MPSSLLSVCLGATDNSLALPYDLHKWNITTKTDCKLCHKQICTAAHVLGSRFALQQDRFTFEHDSVLQVVISVFQSFVIIMQFQKLPATLLSNLSKLGTTLLSNLSKLGKNHRS